MLILAAEVPGHGVRDVRIRAGRIASITAPLQDRRPLGEATLDARGGALLPGLWDHHVHILSLAASLRSLRCGPPEVESPEDLARALRAVPGAGWIRGVGYHESVAGDLDRRILDAWVGDRPVRIQHRSGRLWVLSSAACAAVGAEDGDGRFLDADDTLRERFGEADPPDLAETGRLLARRGVVGITDATFSNGPAELAILEGALASGALPQSLRLMGRADLPVPRQRRATRGERKIVLREGALPRLEDLVADVRSAHASGRGVAVHCVTHAELVFACCAFAEAGSVAGDRLEHASVAPPEALKLVGELGLTVVTQHGFIAERGDAYLRDVEPRERDWLYRGRGFLEAGIALGGGSDAPFGTSDPWRSMAAAVARRTPSGAVLAAGETLTPEEALALFTTAPGSPGADSRSVAVDAAADLCLLDRPWSDARADLGAVGVRATFVAGEPIHREAH